MRRVRINLTCEFIKLKGECHRKECKLVCYRYEKRDCEIIVVQDVVDRHG